MAAEFLERTFYKIHFANGHAAAGDDDVAFGEGADERGASGFGGVGDDRITFWDGTGGGDQRSEGGAVGFEDLAGGEWR